MQQAILRFFCIAIVTTLLFLFLGCLTVGGWYWWTVVRPALPRTGWSDSTIELDEHPVTPHKGGKTITPTIIE